MNYQEFLENKSNIINTYGFKPLWMPDFLFDFQRYLIEWALIKGRAAIFADCGLGKTPMQLVIGQNVIQKTNKPYLLLTPLAVSKQTLGEAEKFGIEAEISRDGKHSGKLVITNYERLHYFDANKFSGIGVDESSILKNFDGSTKENINWFARKIQYRHLYTATAAPNDYIELGTSSEVLGELGYIDMLKMFFKATNNSYAHGGGGAGRFDKGKSFGGKFSFRGHAESEFWRWVCSWARACRKPSDIGFNNDKFKLPPLVINQVVSKVNFEAARNSGFLFTLPASGLKEQRAERRSTLEDRCEKSAELCLKHDISVAWCSLNDEGNLLEKLIPNSIQVAGSDSLENKEERLEAFRLGQIKYLITKPDIAGFGCNWMHCAHATYFPSHSYEQWYQSVRRFWRFGQKRTVTIDMVTSEGELDVVKNLNRKSKNADKMFDSLVELMNSELKLKEKNNFTQKESIPSWL